MSGLAMTIAMRTSSTSTWATPVSLFDPLNAEFDFEVDVCANADNAKVDRYFTESDNGLWQPWAPLRCWMNPPYGRETALWVKKAADEAAAGALVVGLVPARTDTVWFHDHILKEGAEVRFVRGRVPFEGPSRVVPRAPFPSLVIVWRPA